MQKMASARNGNLQCKQPHFLLLSFIAMRRRAQQMQELGFNARNYFWADAGSLFAFVRPDCFAFQRRIRRV